MPQLEHKVRWEVEEELTPVELAKVVTTCKEALIPDHAQIKIISFTNAQGYVVEAKWS